jgi:hypothetical protein
MNSSGHLLAGRVGIFEVDTLSWFEIKELYRELKYPESDFLSRGGYPELHADPVADVGAFFASYLAAYVERDLRAQLQVGNLRDFHRLLRLLALRNGHLLNMSELARDVGISVPTVKSWLIALWGIRQESDLWGSALQGALWETYVLNELLKATPSGGNWRNLYFYRDASGLEVDFVIGGVKPRLIEAKYAEAPTVKDWSNLLKLRHLMGKDVEREVMVVCRCRGDYKLADDVRLIDGFDKFEWLGIPDAMSLAV